MAIVKMKRFELLAMETDRSVLIAGLQRAGCVQIDEPSSREDYPEISQLCSRLQSDLAQKKSDAASIASAIDILSKHGALKRSLLTPKRIVRQREVLDGKALPRALRDAEEIINLFKKENAILGEIGKLENTVASLFPWETVDIPLDIENGRSYSVFFGFIMPQADFAELETRIYEKTPLSQLFYASTTRDGIYIVAICHPEAENELLATLKEVRFSRIVFKDVSGTATANLIKLRENISNLKTEHGNVTALIKSMGERQETLELAYDHAQSLCAKEEATERLMTTNKTFLLCGYVPATAETALTSALSSFDCAMSYEDPAEEEDVPVLLKNNVLTAPFNMVTEMYSLPKYRSIDPNPLMAPFFAIFFGMMYADIGYGLILMAIGLVVMKKKKPTNTSAYIYKLLIYCGAITAFFGFLFGGFFGDVISAFCKTFLGREWQWPFTRFYLNPIENAMQVIYLALALGGIQIIFGMGIKAYILIRDGKWYDALMDVGLWWVVFAGIGVLLFGGGPYVMLAGLGLIVLTAGRHSKGVFGKLLGGVGKLYDITAYLSDLLSYLRLMALALATSVIAMVFNILAGLFGGGVIGFIAFFIIFLVGHAFNMGINIIGTFVHAARLQFLEFFGKFYDDGGKPFSPLTVKTKYVDILKEDN